MDTTPQYIPYHSAPAIMRPASDGDTVAGFVVYAQQARDLFGRDYIDEAWVPIYSGATCPAIYA